MVAMLDLTSICSTSCEPLISNGQTSLGWIQFVRRKNCKLLQESSDIFRWEAIDVKNYRRFKTSYFLCLDIYLFIFRSIHSIVDVECYWWWASQSCSWVKLTIQGVKWIISLYRLDILELSGSSLGLCGLFSQFNVHIFK